MNQREAEELIYTVLTMVKYAKGIPDDGPRRTHNSYATRQELRSILSDPGSNFHVGEADEVRDAARLLRVVMK